MTKEKKGLNDTVTFFVFGLGGLILIILGLIILILSPFVVLSKLAFGFTGIVLIILGAFLRFKYKIRKKLIYLRK